MRQYQMLFKLKVQFDKEFFFIIIIIFFYYFYVFHLYIYFKHKY